MCVCAYVFWVIYITYIVITWDGEGDRDINIFVMSSSRAYRIFPAPLMEDASVQGYRSVPSVQADTNTVHISELDNHGKEKKKEKKKTKKVKQPFKKYSYIQKQNQEKK